MTKGTVGCCVWYRNVSLLFTESIYKLQRHDTRSFHGRRNALLPFAKIFTSCIRAVPMSPSPRCFHEGRNAPLPFAKTIYKLRRRGPRFPDVFTRVGTRLYHSQNTIYKLHRRESRCFYGCRNAPLPVAKIIYTDTIC